MKIIYKKTQDRRIKLVNGWYHARFSKRGQRVQESLETQSFKTAQRMVDAMERLILTGETLDAKFPLFEDLWPKYIEAKAKGERGKRKLRESTLKQIIWMGEKNLKPFFDTHRVDKITERDWDEYVVTVQGKVFNHWKCMHGFMSWCERNWHIKKIPNIYNPDKETDQDGVGKNYTDDELRLFRDCAEMPMKLWILMGQYMGMRSSEITQLYMDRIDLVASVIRLKKQDTKTNQTRIIPIHEEVRPYLLQQMGLHQEGPLFPNRDDKSRPMDKSGFKKPWRALRDAVEVEGRFHDFRHSYATRIFSNPDLNPVIVCKALGMSMEVAMKVYIHFDEQQLHKVADAYSLRSGK